MATAQDKARVQSKFIDAEGNLGTDPTKAVAFRIMRTDTNEAKDYTLRMFPDAILSAAMWFGISNREQNDRNSDGKDSTIETRWENSIAVMEQLMSGTWASREGGRSGGVSLATLAQAVATIMVQAGRAVTAEELLAGLKDPEKYPTQEARDAKVDTWRKSDQVKAEVAKIFAARAAERAEKAPALSVDSLDV